MTPQEENRVLVAAIECLESEVMAILNITPLHIEGKTRIYMNAELVPETRRRITEYARIAKECARRTMEHRSISDQELHKRALAVAQKMKNEHLETMFKGMNPLKLSQADVDVLISYVGENPVTETDKLNE